MYLPTFTEPVKVIRSQSGSVIMASPIVAGLPVTTARYPSAEVRVGAFRVNAALFGNSQPGAALPVKPVQYPVTSAKLPSNLAISFRDRNGILYAGDPDHPAVGDMRVIYRIIPAEKVEIVGTQHGDGVIVKGYHGGQWTLSASSWSASRDP